MHAMALKSWGKDEPLQWLELPTMEPGPGEVRVAVKAVGVNPVDWKMRKLALMRAAMKAFGPPGPGVVGIDFAGVTEAVGPGVKGFLVGQRVVGGTWFLRRQRGSYADSVVVREDQLCLLPDSVDFETAAALPVAGVTAFEALMEVGGLRGVAAPSRKVLILGASGGVGQMAVQLARLEGAAVVGVCSARNAELVRSLGAEVVIDYAQGDALEQAKGHGPFTVIVDCAGGYSASRCRALLQPRGRHVLVSGESAGEMIQPLVPPFTSKSVLARVTTTRLKPVVEAVAAGKMRVNVAHRLPLAQADEAHRLSQTHRLAGKIVLTV